jgi:ubiquinone/menaquinone biosynthesis C-methylase UbiE
MQIHHEAPSDVLAYIAKFGSISLEEKTPQFENFLKVIRAHTPLTPETEILEVGTGTGWFPLLCKARGLKCKGLEISPQLIDVAHEVGRRYGLEPDIELGNLEDYQLPDDFYDVVLASSVFEHVEDWRTGIYKLYRTLKPGGLLYFESTNKFSLTSGEYAGIPLYGWLPDSWRYGFRKIVHGPDIMKLGIDFHQFRHGVLRREFEKVGFRQVMDRVDASREENVSSNLRRNIVRISKEYPLAKALALTFAEATRFVCIK